MAINEVRCVAPVGDVVGEAAVWSADENRLYWVDACRFLVHIMDHRTGAVTSRFFDEPAVAISLTDEPGRLLVALASHLIYLDVDSDERHDLGVRVEGSPDIRFNDGRSDPLGAFWIGSMGNNIGPDGEPIDMPKDAGTLYRYRAGGPLETVESGIDISNTLCWSPDRSVFYFGDTTRNEIRAYPYDMTTGDIGEGRSHFAGFERGLPDGSAIDSDGYIWNCRFGGGCVVRVAPDGQVDRVVDMPVKNITTCAFGGPDLKTLFITTASLMKDDTDRLAGSIFAIDTDVPGLPENRFST